MKYREHLVRALETLGFLVAAEKKAENLRTKVTDGLEMEAIKYGGKGKYKRTRGDTIHGS